MRGGVMRRETLWFGASPFDQGLAAGAAVLLSSLNAAALALRPFTLIRLRGVAQIMSDQVTADERQFGILAQAVVSDQASAIGITAVPTPVTDSGSDLFFQFTPMISDVNFVTGTGVRPLANQYEIDSKAMRKVEDGQDIISVVENGAVVGSIITGFTRLLIKLH